MACTLLSSLLLSALASFPVDVSAPLLYALHRGEIEKAFSYYEKQIEEGAPHDFTLLQQTGRALLEQGIRTQDPEIHLMCMFGAGVARSSDVLSILEKGLKSPDMRMQLIALTYLCALQDDAADHLLIEALSSPFLLTRLEVLLHLAQKNHPLVLNHLYSLVTKVPDVVRPAFAQIAIHLEGVEAHRYMRQLLGDGEFQVRVAAILSAAENRRDDLLPTLRLLSTEACSMQQEAAAYALGLLKDTASIEVLHSLIACKQESVSLAALYALYTLGEEERGLAIQEAARQGSLYAISLLSHIEGAKDTLASLLSHTDREIRLNASLALLAHSDTRALAPIEEFLIDTGADLGFWRISSPGSTLHSWRCFPAAQQRESTYPGITQQTLQLRERILSHCMACDEQTFLRLARTICEKNQHGLVPLLMELLQNKKSPAVIQFLQEGSQKMGAPLIRNYCTLALYRLQEPGPYEAQLISWMKTQGSEEIIRFHPEKEPSRLESSYSLTPEETSRFLLEACEALASAQNRASIEALVYTIAHGHPKNRYALAGMLMRMTE